MRELPNECGFTSDNASIIIISALCALRGLQPKTGVEADMKLLDAADEYIFL